MWFFNPPSDTQPNKSSTLYSVSRMFTSIFRKPEESDGELAARSLFVAIVSLLGSYGFQYANSLAADNNQQNPAPITLQNTLTLGFALFASIQMLAKFKGHLDACAEQLFTEDLDSNSPNCSRK